METLATLHNVTHIYHDLTNETLAIDNISFSVDTGEFVAIVGPSGCGKTTLLSILSGLLTPTSGSVTICGQDVKNSDVGYMLQHDHLLEWQTIMSNTLLGLRIQHKLNDATKAYASELLDRYGLSEFKNSYPRQLSGGMRQKAALIRTLALDPRMLLLDEPFSALDFQTRLNVADEVRNIILTENRTAILVTHDISEAVALADRVIVLTKRPARIKVVYDINVSGDTSFMRRKDPAFVKYFDMIWRDLQN